MGRTGKESTKRSVLLLRALDSIDRNAYDEFEKYLIFGGILEEFLSASCVQNRQPAEEESVPPAERPSIHRPKKGVPYGAWNA